MSSWNGRLGILAAGAVVAGMCGPPGIAAADDFAAGPQLPARAVIGTLAEPETARIPAPRNQGETVFPALRFTVSRDRSPAMSDACGDPPGGPPRSGGGIPQALIGVAGPWGDAELAAAANTGFGGTGDRFGLLLAALGVAAGLTGALGIALLGRPRRT